MTRRTILLAMAALPLRAADPEQQVWDALTTMAADLSESNAAGFLHEFDPAMPGYNDLSVAVTGLLNEAELESTIEPVENTGDAAARTVKVQWALRLVSRSGLDQVKDRQEEVSIRFERRKGKWKAVSFAPLSLFRGMRL
jgi:hypothetical protein